MIRILGIELRRSAALGTAAIVAVAGTLLMYFAEGIDFADGWMQLAMTQRLYLAILWPLALAAGAWQARREHRTKVAELFGSTPRPPALRMVPTIGAMAVGVVAGYLVMGIAGAVYIAGTARYLPVQAFAVTAVGALALIAAAWLGLAVGRLLPSPVTAPALGIAGLALLLFIPFLTKPRGWLALVFSPITEMNMPGPYATAPGRVSAAQAIWLLALAAAALLLLASEGRRMRVAALLPVALGVALAVGVMPHQNRIVTDAVDPVAQELVCADGGQVCVSRVHEGMLDDVAAEAKRGLAALAKLPGAPVKVHEDTTTYVPDRFPEWHDDVVLVRVSAGDSPLYDANPIESSVVIGAFNSRPECEKSVAPQDQLAAAAWLMGRAPAADDLYAEAFKADATEIWQSLGALPAEQAKNRVAALRQAALACSAEEGMLTR